MDQSDSKIKVKSNIKTISCNGGRGASGHPQVYYNFGNKNQIQCQYCGLIFFKSS